MTMGNMTMETNHSQTMMYYREPAQLLTAHDQLLDLLSARRGERHIIVLHAYPDPDAISSAYAHRLISAHYGVETDIVYCGAISHGQNIALIRLLNLISRPIILGSISNSMREQCTSTIKAQPAAI